MSVIDVVEYLLACAPLVPRGYRTFRRRVRPARTGARIHTAEWMR